MEGRRRLTLLDQMSASGNGRDLAGLSLDDVLLAPAAKQPPPAPALPPTISGRTLLDIIRDEEPKSYRALIGKKDKKAWKSFKDRLRLKRAGSAWASSVLVPTSDIPIRNNTVHGSNHQHLHLHLRSRRSSVRYVTPETNLDMVQQGDESNSAGMRQISRRSSTRFGPNSSIPPDEPDSDSPGRAPMFSRRSSVRFTADEIATDSPRRRLSAALEEERSLSAREAVAAQVAAEAAAAAASAEEAEATDAAVQNDMPSADGGAAATTTEAEPVRMSLMDLLEETDRQMGLESRYTMDDDEEEEYEEEEEEEEEQEEVGNA